MSFKSLIILFAFVGIFSDSFSQETEGPYQKEYIVGVDLNTNGGLIGGGIFRYGTRVKKDRYRIFEIEIVNVKHDKEFRTSSSITGNTFIYKKENYLIPIRFRFGRQYLLFPAAQEEGVRVDFLWAGGVALGIQKAYTVQYDSTEYPNPNPVVVTLPYRSGINDDNILGGGGFFTGLNHTKIVPALNLKAGFVFQFVQFGGSVSGVEVGGMVEAYPHNIPILAQSYNRSVFTSVYINLFYGSHK